MSEPAAKTRTPERPAVLLTEADDLPQPHPSLPLLGLSEPLTLGGAVPPPQFVVRRPPVIVSATVPSSETCS